MTDKLKEFLTRNHACAEGLDRLATTGAKTLEEAFERVDASDLVWAVTRPGVMSDDQRRRFLAEAILAPVEDQLTDERSKNILQKLRTNERITDADRLSAAEAAAEAASAARSAAYAADAADAASAAYAASRAAAAAATASWAAADATAREAQAKWIRDNFTISDLNIK
jgi:nucleoid-associated protein YgaU